jgi:TonB family protein
MALLLVPFPHLGAIPISITTSGVVSDPSSLGRTSLWREFVHDVERTFGLIWAAVAAVLGMKIALGAGRLWKLTRGARHESDDIYITPATATPLTWGAFRPVILLPEYTSQWTLDERERAIRHEQAHILRHDWAWQLFAQAMTVIFWFHPLVWVAAAGLRREADLAADNAVMAAGADAANYAAQLLEVARMYQGPHYAAGVNMIRTSKIEGRILSILNPSLVRKPAGWVARLSVAMGVLALFLPLAAFQGEDVHKGSEPGIKGPVIIYKVDPDYTQKAKDEHVEGSVLLDLIIGSNGLPHDVIVARSLYPGLDENAVAAISTWKFKPAEKDGKPVAISAKIEVNFKLR